MAIVSGQNVSAQRDNQTGATTRRTTALLHVKLIADGGRKDVLIGTYLAGERSKARAFARGAAEFLGVEFAG